MTSEIDLSQFWCWNEECPDYGNKAMKISSSNKGTVKTIVHFWSAEHARITLAKQEVQYFSDYLQIIFGI